MCRLQVAPASTHNKPHTVPTCPLASQYENMTSSVMLEAHKVSQPNQRRTKPRPQTTCTKNLVKFSHAAYELCKWTDW